MESWTSLRTMRKDYYEKNKEEIKARRRERYRKHKEYERNKEEIKAKRRRYYEENKEKLKAKAKEYRIILKEKQPWINSYRAMRQRCNNPNAYGYEYYGGRGIKCSLSKEDVAFLWERDRAQEMQKPTIDRIDNDGDYTLENCRFIELSENVRKRNKNQSKEDRD